MTLERVSAKEAKALIDNEGHVLLDVRSIPEFGEEHAEGAYNVPYLHKAPHGMVPNQEFARVVQGRFPDKTTKLITTCQMGGRSVRAAQELKNLGYENVIDLRGGFGGERDAAGNVTFAGWKDSDLPTGSGEPEGRGYRSVHKGVADQTVVADDCAPEEPAAPTLNRWAHPTRTVQCAKFGKDLPALKRTPMGGPLGKRLKREASADAWAMWIEHSKMIINEYRMNPADPKSQQMLIEQCEEFFFGEGSKLPEGFVPEAMAK